MNVFDEAIRQGLMNAGREDNAVMYINRLLGELSHDVQNVTGGKVSIGVSGWSRENLGPAPGVVLSYAVLNKLRHYKLVAYREGYLCESAELLADWYITDKGWPCEVRHGHCVRRCADLGSLNEALHELMSSPRAGIAIMKVVDFQPGDFQE